jgi:hypothetical protein
MCNKELKNISKWSCYWSNHVSRHLAGRRPLEFKKFKIWTCGSLWGSQSKIYCLDFLWCNFSLLRSLEKMYLIILRSKLKINKSFSPINWSHCCLLDAFYKGTKRTCKRYLWSWWCTQWIVLLLQNLLCSTMNLSVTCNQVEQV